MFLGLKNERLALIPIQESDFSVLLEIYASTRANEMDMLTQWTAEQKNEFLKSQFQAQHIHYQNNYLGAYFWLIKKDNIAIGRLYFKRNFTENSSRIIDISILPNWRNKGIGESILQEITKEENKLKNSVTIHVEANNPAMKLYERLGFVKISETNGVYFLFEKGCE